jgi:hypothetical protein
VRSAAVLVELPRVLPEISGTRARSGVGLSEGPLEIGSI